MVETAQKQRIKIKALRQSPDWEGQTVTLKGWVRTVRAQKNFAFVELNDGSSVSNFQVIYTGDLPADLSTGASIAVTGKVTASPGKNQQLELHATELKVLGACDPETFPLQKKRHSFEFLRTIAHLRPRTNTLGAVARVRSAAAFATHRFFQERGFFYIQTPIITASDCEGAGEMFHVTTLDPENIPKTPEGKPDYTKDFFSKPAFLTVSGQLNGEIFACALSDIYTFGPTFRAENSNTSRHVAEFWMIEPEMAFSDIHDNMENAEAFLKYVIKYVLENCAEDMEFFDKFVAEGQVERLQKLVEAPFERMTYTKAVDVLTKSGKTFEFPVQWGTDLQSEHERYLTEEVVKGPLIVTDYPRGIKAFYMRNNEDGKTVAAMDVLVPRVGEIIGGSQREERLDVLEQKLRDNQLDPAGYWWYLELRKYGSVPHVGYGAGFERLVGFLTGMESIRDICAFPRYPGHAEF